MTGASMNDELWYSSEIRAPAPPGVCENVEHARFDPTSKDRPDLGHLHPKLTRHDWHELTFGDPAKRAQRRVFNGINESCCLVTKRGPSSVSTIRGFIYSVEDSSL